MTKTMMLAAAAAFLVSFVSANEALAAGCYGKKCDYVEGLIQDRESNRRGFSRRTTTWEVQREASREGVSLSRREAENLADYLNRPPRGLSSPRHSSRFQRQAEARGVLDGEYDRRN